jgi:hypothetical protein
VTVLKALYNAKSLARHLLTNSLYYVNNKLVFLSRSERRFGLFDNWEFPRISIEEKHFHKKAGLCRLRGRLNLAITLVC